MNFAKNTYSDYRSIASVQVVSGLEINHGGPSYSVPRLNEALISCGINGKIFSDLSAGDSANDSADTCVTFERQFGRFPLLGKMHFCRAMRRRLVGSADKIDVIQSHGLWRMPNIYAAEAARLRNIPHVVSPRGMLSRIALGFSRSSKAVFWQALQKNALYGASCFHATSESEKDEIRALGFKSPIAVIPNGIDLPNPIHLSSPKRETATRTLLYFGRIHPKKGMDILIPAWTKVAERYPDWRLRIVGPVERQHLAQLNQLVAEKRAPRVSIEPPVYDDEKWRIYSEADVFVLPTHNENFGLTVAESLACNRPVVVTKGAPWSGVESNHCGWWVDANVNALSDGLIQALGTPVETLDSMGRRGGAWMHQDFAWSRVGTEMSQVYYWLLEKGDRPECIDIYAP